jgi:tetratricopeptide (TPR) repeat protein
MAEDAIEALRDASRSPRQRFAAASLLGRLLRDRGERSQAVEWFEHAAEVPPPDPATGHALLYDLAETLEEAGEETRALAVFVELEAESGGYRDVATRIARLTATEPQR